MSRHQKLKIGHVIKADRSLYVIGEKGADGILYVGQQFNKASNRPEAVQEESARLTTAAPGACEYVVTASQVKQTPFGVFQEVTARQLKRDGRYNPSGQQIGFVQAQSDNDTSEFKDVTRVTVVGRLRQVVNFVPFKKANKRPGSRLFNTETF